MRKLASLQRVRAVVPIAGADAIERIDVLGWSCVAKKGEFRAGDWCVYFEIDALLPERPEFEFLRKSSWKADLGRYRLKTVRLRGTLSQGLALPPAVLPALAGVEPAEGLDVTARLGVERYEAPIPAELEGKARPFAWPIAKTDEERIQSRPELAGELAGRPYVITVKLDGTSGTFVLGPDGEFHVCGRNRSYWPDDDNTYWKVARRHDLEGRMRAWRERTGAWVALQGEVVGPGLQRNRLGLADHEVYGFTVWIDGRRAPFGEALAVARELGVPWVPVVERGDGFARSVAELLEMAPGLYAEHFPGAKGDREGIVVRSADQAISFKVISNRFLLKEEG